MKRLLLWLWLSNSSIGGPSSLQLTTYGADTVHNTGVRLSTYPCTDVVIHVYTHTYMITDAAIDLLLSVVVRISIPVLYCCQDIVVKILLCSWDLHNIYVRIVYHHRFGRCRRCSMYV